MIIIAHRFICKQNVYRIHRKSVNIFEKGKQLPKHKLLTTLTIKVVKFTLTTQLCNSYQTAKILWHYLYNHLTVVNAQKTSKQANAK